MKKLPKDLKGKCFKVKETSKQTDSNCFMIVHDLLPSGDVNVSLFSFDEEEKIGVFYTKQDKVYSELLYNVLEEIPKELFLKKLEEFSNQYKQFSIEISQ